MAQTNQYQELFRSRVMAAIEQARSVAAMDHQGVKGQILEILVGQLLRPLLPADIGIGSGTILCSYTGRQSQQIDIVLYNQSIVPPLLVDSNVGVFPIESVLYTIEVKTTLSAAELRSAHESAADIAHEFRYRPGKIASDGSYPDHRIEKVRSVVFALNSDLSGNRKTEADRYIEIYGNSSPHIRAICVADKEYWYDNGSHWIGYKEGSRFDEVLAFIGGISNTYRRVSESRGSPFLGNYIIPDPASLLARKWNDSAVVAVICASCQFEAELTPDLGELSIQLNGSIKSTTPCPRCGGEMSSDTGQFTFKNGRLVESSA